MQGLLVVLTVVLLVIISPAFLIQIATTWKFGHILLGWTVIVLAGGLALWPTMKKKLVLN